MRRGRMQPPLSKCVQCQAYNGNITALKQGLLPRLKLAVDQGVISIHFLPVKQQVLVQRPVSSSSRRCCRSSPLHPNTAPCYCPLERRRIPTTRPSTSRWPRGEGSAHGESLDMSPIMVGSVEIGPKHKAFCLRTLTFRKHKARHRTFSRVLPKVKILSIYQNVPIDYPTSSAAQPPGLDTYMLIYTE